MNDTPTPPTGNPFPPPPPPPPTNRPAGSGSPMQPIYIQTPASKSGAMSRIAGGLVVSLLMFSLVLNIYFAVLLSVSRRGPMSTTTLQEGDEAQTVAVYAVAGMIDDEQAERFRSFVRHVRDEEGVRAVVLRVNSPGGGVSASDVIHMGVQELKMTGRPVVVSMGNVAASGGYYISAGADYIYAEPTTITGSIGVISQIPIVTDAMEKIGVEVKTMRSSASKEHKAALNPFEQPTPVAVEEMQDLLDRIQDIFNEVVASGRPRMTEEELGAVTNGRVFLGAEAVDRKLVDEVGYLHDAIKQAETMAGLVNPRVQEYKRRESIMEGILARSAAPGVTIDRGLLDGLRTPSVMLLWVGED